MRCFKITISTFGLSRCFAIREGAGHFVYSRIVGTVLVVAFVGYHRRLEGAIPELSNDMPEMKVLTPSPREEK